MIKKNENVNVRKNIGKRRNKQGFTKYDARAILLTIVVAIFAVFVLIRTFNLVKIMAGSTKVLLDKWVNGEISYVETIDLPERSLF